MPKKKVVAKKQRYGKSRYSTIKEVNRILYDTLWDEIMGMDDQQIIRRCEVVVSGVEDKKGAEEYCIKKTKQILRCARKVLK